jgi:ABC-type phosphate transport system permease subunit
VSPALERLFVTAARLCAVAVVAIAPLVCVVVFVAAIAAIIVLMRPGVVFPWDGFTALIAATLALGLVGATLGTALGVGAALYAVEIATAGNRQLIKALVGALHAVPAVGYGVVAAGVLLVTPLLPNPTVTFAIASTVITVMIASVVFVQMRRALSALPDELREASTAAGADPVATALRAMLPALQRSIAGIWWASFALALGEATALQMIFSAASAKAAGAGPVAGTLASMLLQVGASAQGDALRSAPAALVLFVMAIASVLLGRRAVGHVPWP